MKYIRLLAVFAVLLATLVLIVGAGGTGASAAPAEYKTHDDLLLDIGRRVPEFGGMFLSEDNTVLYVYVTGNPLVLRTEVVKRAIEDVLKASPTQRRELRLIPATYSLVQLHKWYNDMQDVAFANPRVVMTDLDEGQNRIEIGVDNLDAEQALRAAVTSLGIPDKALVISLRERPIPASHDLQDRASGNTMEGGYQVTGFGGRLCTLGFNTERSGEAGFITNGHCTQSGDYDGGVDGTQFHQPSSLVNSTAIGTETIDPTFSSDPPTCPAGKVCRYSDSAFIRFASGVSYNLGKIAKTTGMGSIDVHHQAKFRIVAERSYYSVRETVNKVGRTTGWTRGRVTDTCVPIDLPNNHRLLCQVIANFQADSGDSGSPVFAVTNSPTVGDVQLLGIFWGGIAPQMYFSPVGGIYRDLGMTDAWDSCDPDFDC